MHDRVAEFGQTMGGGVREATLEMYTPLHPIEPPQRIIRDIAYGPHSRHLLDVHLPAIGVLAPRPVLLFVHGGGFVGGDKGGPGRPLYDNIGRFAVEKGFIGVTMTYRLAPDHVWPAGGEDVALALQYLAANVAAYGGDADRLTVFGHSAGGAHVATFLADEHLRDIVPGLRAAVLSSGIYEPATLRDESYSSYYGSSPEDLDGKTSIPRLSRCDVPFLVLVAEFDPPDFHRQASSLLDSFVRERGHFPSFVIGVGHNHFSSPAHYGTPDHELSSLVACFLARACR